MHNVITIGFIYKYLLPAILGASAKTYFDYQAGRCSGWKLWATWFINTCFAIPLAFWVGAIIHGEFPDKPHFVPFVSGLVGLLAINFITAVNSINWKSVIAKRLVVVKDEEK